MIQNIVFDMGNVRFAPREMAVREGVPEEWVDSFVREVFGNMEWISMDRGVLTAEEAAVTVCARLPEFLHPAARKMLFGWWHTPFDIIPGIEALIRELKAMGYGLYLLSNASVKLHVYFDRLPACDCFDGVLVSADWKMLKPHRDIYETFCREHRLNSADCLFVDDSPANIDGAMQIGMDGIVFLGSVARLRRDMAAHGVPVRPEAEGLPSIHEKK